LSSRGPSCRRVPCGRPLLFSYSTFARSQFGLLLDALRGRDFHLVFLRLTRCSRCFLGFDAWFRGLAEPSRFYVLFQEGMFLSWRRGLLAGRCKRSHLAIATLSFRLSSRWVFQSSPGRSHLSKSHLLLSQPSPHEKRHRTLQDAEVRVFLFI